MLDTVVTEKFTGADVDCVALGGASHGVAVGQGFLGWTKPDAPTFPVK